jgi:hypothetical protein
VVLIIGQLVEKLVLMCFGGRLWRKCHFMSRITEGWSPEPACPVSADAPFSTGRGIMGASLDVNLATVPYILDSLA